MLSSGSLGIISTVNAGAISRPDAIQNPRLHAGRRAAALLAHGNLPDAALPGEEMLANSVGRKAASPCLLRVPVVYFT